MESPDRQGEGHTDVAALSAAIVAVAVSMFVVEGPFQVVGALVAMTLAFVIAGYVWGSSRPSRVRSLAVAAVFGVLAIQIVGFTRELYLAHERLSFLWEGKLRNCPAQTTWGTTYWMECTHPQSQVENSWLIVTWAVTVLLVLAADRLRQRKNRRLKILAAALARELRN
jgi:hypothetical protein